MEFSARVIWLERALALLLLAAVLGAARLDARSPIARDASEDRPWSCWLALRAKTSEPPDLFWALYQPARGVLTLIHVPENYRLRGRRTLSQVFATERRRQMGEVAAARGMAEAAQPTLEEALPRGVVDAPAFYLDSMPAGDDEPALKARRWLLSRVGPLGLWRSLARRRLGKGLPPFEAYRVAQEIHGLNPVLIQAADLPEGRQLAPYLARLLAAPRPLRRPITAEVLNASSLDGLASDIAKILRSRGVDVVDTGNASPRQRTLVYDRSGRPELAAEVRRLLRCPSAEALTKLEPARLIDVTVAVADDCAARE